MVGCVEMRVCRCRYGERDLPARLEELKKAGLHFRNQMGPGGKQIQLEDPDGNPIELFERAR